MSLQNSWLKISGIIMTSQISLEIRTLLAAWWISRERERDGEMRRKLSATRIQHLSYQHQPDVSLRTIYELILLQASPLTRNLRMSSTVVHCYIVDSPFRGADFPHFSPSWLTALSMPQQIQGCHLFINHGQGALPCYIVNSPSRGHFVEASWGAWQDSKLDNIWTFDLNLRLSAHCASISKRLNSLSQFKS